MSASAMVVRHGFDGEQSSSSTGFGSRPRIGARRRLRSATLRLDPGRIVLVGFAAATGWAFVGSLLLGLGTGSTSRAAAWLWLAGKALIGAVVFAALTLGVPPGDDA